MGRKVFISVLGAGFYGECKYVYPADNFTSSLTRYIQCATLEKICDEKWDSSSAGYVLVTPKAQSENWDKNITEKMTRDGMVPYVGLEKAIEDMNLPFNVSPVPISEGKTEQEILDIFLNVYDVLKDGDELYIDLTHGFRYLPMLMLVLANYAKFTKHVTCESFSYGNFELREKVDDVFVSPIIDLKSLSLIQDWTDAVEHLFFSGNTKKIVDLSSEQLKRSRGKDVQYKVLRKFVGPLDAMTKDMKTCQGTQLVAGEHIKRLMEQVISTEQQALPPVFRTIFEKVASEFSSFGSNEGWKNGIYAAKWCFDHQQYQQAITLMRESIVTGVCQHFGLDWTKESDRNQISSLLAMVGKAYGDVKQSKGSVSVIDSGEEVQKKLADSNYLLSLGRNRLSGFEQLFVKHIADDKNLLRLVNVYYIGRIARNQYNHAGFLDPQKNKSVHYDSEGLIKQIKSRIDDIMNWFSETQASSDLALGEEKLFINISNHPVSRWGDSQKGSAKRYGKISEIPFPEVPERGNPQEIEGLCKEYMTKILVMSNYRPCTIHIMGEMTFTYAMVNLLKSHGYTCVASTTKRIVEELPDGSKNVKFEFCQFREY